MAAMVEHIHSQHHGMQHFSYSAADIDILRAITHTSSKRRPPNTRRPQLDPLILETAASSGPHVTRNHFLHEYYPHPEDPSSSFSFPHGRSARHPAYSSCDVGPDSDAEHTSSVKPQGVFTQTVPSAIDQTGLREAFVNGLYSSRQAPRKIRLEREKQEEEEKRNNSALSKGKGPSVPGDEETRQTDKSDDIVTEHADDIKSLSPSSLKVQPRKTPRRASVFHPDPIELPKLLKASRPSNFPAQITQSKGIPQGYHTATSTTLQVQCMGRTRVPTPHGEVFLHLYKNNMDDKEHLAFVFDREQLDAPPPAEDEEPVRGKLRSASLDAVWRTGETHMERIVRGAYVGRLSSSAALASEPPSSSSLREDEKDEAVLIRVHSECFTGETIGSQRCDCGEQLDEAFRLISSSPSGLGVIVYLRQEGRGIGLLEKIKAYNLQDLGHDTVTANLLLGHSADMRTYGIAGEVLRDLGISRVRLLTNNPDKIDSVEKEGIKVLERVPMVPRGWSAPVPHVASAGRRKKKSTHTDSEGEAGSYEFPSAPGTDDDETTDSEAHDDYLIAMNRTGVGMIGGGTTHSVELERYLKTKVERMGHLLNVPSTPPSTPLPLRRARKGRKKRPGKSLMESVESINTDPEPVNCEEGCTECADEEVNEGV